MPQVRLHELLRSEGQLNSLHENRERVNFLS